MLDHLHIQHFKCFRDLRIEPLGRVNLITGKNNTGKTSLLEGVMLYADPAKAFATMPVQRGAQPRRSESSAEAQEPQLYYRKQEIAHERERLRRLFHQGDITQSAWVNDFCLTMEEQPLALVEGFLKETIQQPLLSWQANGERANRPVEWVGSVKPSHDDLVPLLERVLLTPQEDALYSFLHLLEPKLMRVGVKHSHYQDSIQVRLAEETQAIPLTQLGEGLQRMLLLYLHLTQARDGFLLIDEIETGLHHAMMEEVWGHLFRLCVEHNVQLFATTHSADCVEAFAKLGREEAWQSHAKLTRLHRDQAGQVQAETFEPAAVYAAVEMGIEAR